MPVSQACSPQSTVCESMGMIPSSHRSETCERHTVCCCVAVDAVGVAVCCCGADRLRASFNFRPWLGIVAERYLAVHTVLRCTVLFNSTCSQAAPQSWPTFPPRHTAVLCTADCVQAYQPVSHPALHIPSCPVPLCCCNPSMRHMQLASPQPKTPVANGQPRPVALYRILHLIKARPVR